MPTASPRPCCHPGCRKYASKRGYCDDHQKDRQAYDDRRGNSAARGYGPEWRRERAIFLRANSLCVRCMKKNLIVPSTVVDHIVPHKGDMVLFWDKTNWQALCKPCHDSKTATEDKGAWGRG